MTSAAPARKPYRKAPPQHRETRHALPVALATPAPQHDLSQVNQHSSDMPPTAMPQRSTGAKQPQRYGLQRGGPTSPLPLSDSELEVSSLSSLEVCVPPSGRFNSQSQRTHPARSMTSQGPAAVRKPSPSRRLPEDRRHHSAQRSHTAGALATAPRSILKHSEASRLKHTYDIIRKSQSVELLGDSKGEDSYVPQPPISCLRRSERCRNSRSASDPSSPCGTRSNEKIRVLQEKVRFSNFLDEITCRVMSPAHLSQLGKPPSVKARGRTAAHLRSDRGGRQSEETSAERSHRWDNWVSAVERANTLQEEAGRRRGDGTDRMPPKREKGAKRDVQQRRKHFLPLSDQSAHAHLKVGVHVLEVPGGGHW